MSVSLWRLAADSGPYRADDLSGAGAERYGGRFNSANRGTFVVYASAQVSLTALETLVHTGLKARAATANRYLIEITVPQQVFSARQIMTTADLRHAGLHFWDAVPASSNAQVIGDNFVKAGASLLLQLPSAIVAHQDVPDLNFLINPRHADFAKLAIVRREKFVYDPRLV